MAKARKAGITAVIEEVESLAKRLRSDFRRRAAATGLPRDLRSAAAKLRKRAQAAAEGVEEYVLRQGRLGLERAAKLTAQPSRRAAKPKRKRVAARLS